MTQGAPSVNASINGTAGPQSDPEDVRRPTGSPVATVRAVIPLTESQRERLRTYLSKLVERPVELNVRLDPSILGGVWIRLDDMVIDGTVKGRLSALHQQLCESGLTPKGTVESVPERQ
ncbi:MAG: F0F1 ATP synthase subunit delta [Anaerolineae bacterium]|jgi:hypothetical protein|nr:F0F1 ATP synthase subunit delta [Chloroflexota bacterium]